MIVAAVAAIYYVFLPVLILLSPWQPRVIVRLAGGEDLIFRDLKDDDEFVREIRAGIAPRASNS